MDDSGGPGVIVCVGEACLDYIGHVDVYPRPGTRSFATHSYIGGGGKAANAAVAVSRLAKGRDITANLIFCGRGMTNTPAASADVPFAAICASSAAIAVAEQHVALWHLLKMRAVAPNW